jgi:periplasmic mercuric ion binding protein
MKLASIALAALVVGGFSVSNASATVVTDTIHVTSMECGMCESRVQKTLKKIESVTKVEADAETGNVVVTFDNEKTSLAKLEKAIAEIGYHTKNEKATASSVKSLPTCCRRD